MNENNLNNQQANAKSNTLVATLLIILIVLVIGIFVYFEFIKTDDNKVNNNGNNGGSIVEPTPTSTPVATPTATPTATPNNITCSDCVNTVKCDGTKKTAKILVNDKIRTVSCTSKYNPASIDAIQIDGIEVYSNPVGDMTDVEVINGQYILIPAYSNYSFYDSNLNKIDLVLDQEYPEMKATYIGESGKFEFKNNKLIVGGRRNSGYAKDVMVGTTLYELCENGKLNPEIADQIRNKVAEAKYEITYENGKLSSKRVSGSEYYYTDYNCAN